MTRRHAVAAAGVATVAAVAAVLAVVVTGGDAAPAVHSANYGQANAASSEYVLAAAEGDDTALDRFEQLMVKLKLTETERLELMDDATNRVGIQTDPPTDEATGESDGLGLVGAGLAGATVAYIDGKISETDLYSRTKGYIRDVLALKSKVGTDRVRRELDSTETRMRATCGICADAILRALDDL